MPRTRPAADNLSVASASTDTPPVINALTGIRLIAAMWVVPVHLREPMFEILPATRVLQPFLDSGFLALDIFFVLSGFIISLNYAERLSTLDRRSYGAFLWARIGRIYPVHLVALGVMALLVAYVASLGSTANPHSHYTVDTFIGNVLMLQAFPGVDPWNWPSWSVSSEFAAYLLFPFAAAALFRVRRRTALVLAVVVVVIQVAALNALMHTPFYVISLFWVRIAGEFTLGCLLWAAWRRGVRPHWRWDVTALAAVGVTALILISVPPSALAFVAVPFLAIFIVAAASATGVVRTVLASRPLVWGGRITYSLYLMHSPVIMLIMVWYPPVLYTGMSPLTRVAIVASWFLAVLVVGAVTYHVVEEPARTWMRRRAAAWPIGYRDRRRQADPPEARDREAATGVATG